MENTFIAEPVSSGMQRLHSIQPVSYTHLRAHETRHDLVCRLLLEKNGDHRDLHLSILRQRQMCIRDSINPYHGKYLHRGTSVVRDATFALDTTVYHQKYVVDDEIWALVTLSLIHI